MSKRGNTAAVLKGRGGQCFVLALMLIAIAVPVRALTPLSDNAMAEVQGRDGITIHLEEAASQPSLSLGGINWAGQQASVQWDMVASDINTVDPMTSDLLIDAGTISGTPTIWLDWTLNVPDFRLLATNFFHSSNSVAQNGELAVDGGFDIHYEGPMPGMLPSGSTVFDFDMRPTNIYYRQGGAGVPEWNLSNYQLDLSYSGGDMVLDAEGGLRTTADSVFVRFLGDYSFDPTGGSPFAIDASDRPTITSGWEGSLSGFRADIASGGSWTGGDAGYLPGTENRTSGLRLGLRWNFDDSVASPSTPFTWVLGETDDPAATGKSPTIRFDEWRPMDANTFSFNFPNITVAPIAPAEAPGGLCWLGLSNNSTCSDGGSYVDVPAETGAVALLIRDGHLGAYSSRVQIQDDINGDGDYLDTNVAVTDGGAARTQNETVSYGWGLIYTWGDADANFYLYPGAGNADTRLAGATVPGFKLDGALKFQSRAQDSGDMDNDGNTTEILGPDITSNDAYTDFVHGTHFMVADTDKNLAVGFHSADMLIAFNDLNVSVLNTGLNLDTNQARVQFKGRFGGGTFPTLAKAQKGFDLNANLEFSKLSLTLNGSPAGAQYLQYSGILDFADTDIANFSHTNSADNTVDDGSFISIAEPGRPEVDIRMAQITGRVEIANGRVDLQPINESAANDVAKLLISNDLLIGATAGGAPLQIGRVEFGDRNLGQIVVPSGQWHATFGLKCQATGGVC